MFNTFLVFLGCGAGGVFRYWVTAFVYETFDHALPHGTMIVNVSGSFFIGLLTVFLQERMSEMDVQLRALLLVGFLGGYTTFSSFSMDTLNLINMGRYLSALAYIIGSILLCMIGVWAGTFTGKQLLIH